MEKWEKEIEEMPGSECDRSVLRKKINSMTKEQLDFFERAINSEE